MKAYAVLTDEMGVEISSRQHFNISFGYKMNSVTIDYDETIRLESTCPERVSAKMQVFSEDADELIMTFETSTLGPKDTISLVVAT